MPYVVKSQKAENIAEHFICDILGLYYVVPLIQKITVQQTAAPANNRSLTASKLFIQLFKTYP